MTTVGDVLARVSNRCDDRVLLRLERPSPRLPRRSLPIWRRQLATAAVHAAVGGAAKESAARCGILRARCRQRLALMQPAHAHAMAMDLPLFRAPS